MEISLNMYHTIALAVVVYYLGQFIRDRVNFFQKYCIPSPVIGGMIAALIITVLRVTGVMIINLDTTLQTVCMLVFFCSIGFNARWKVLKKGGIGIIIVFFAIAALCTIQNGFGAVMMKIFGKHPLLGTAIGSVPLVGGHGTSASFGQLIEDMGVPAAASASVAAATYGLIAGCMIGGPIARLRILQLQKKGKFQLSDCAEKLEETEKKPLNEKRLMLAVALLLMAVGAGQVISSLIGKLMTFSAAVGSLAAGCIVRNFCDAKKIELPDEEIEMTGNISLHLFLSMAMMSMKIWELVDLAVPMIVTLLLQTVICGLFAYFVIFNIMGRDYDAAVMASGVCGFGLGATPNAIANMSAVVDKYGPAPRAFLIIPIAGSMLADIVNSTVITVFMNIFG